MKKKFNRSHLIESIASSMGRMFEGDGYSILDEVKRRAVPDDDDNYDEVIDPIDSQYENPETQEDDDLGSDQNEMDFGDATAEEANDAIDAQENQQADTGEEPMEPEANDGGISQSDEENRSSLEKFGLEKDEGEQEEEQIARGNAILRAIHVWQNKYGEDFSQEKIENWKAEIQRQEQDAKTDPMADPPNPEMVKMVKKGEEILGRMADYQKKYGYEFDEETHLRMKQDYNFRHSGKAEEEDEELEKEYRRSAVFPKNPLYRQNDEKGLSYSSDSGQLVKDTWNKSQRDRAENLMFYKVTDHFADPENGFPKEQIGMIPEFAMTAMKGFGSKYNDDILKATALMFGRLVGSEQGLQMFPEIREAAGKMSSYLYNTVLSKNSLNPDSYTPEENNEAKNLANELRIQVVMALSGLKKRGNGDIMKGMMTIIPMDDIRDAVADLRKTPHSDRADQINRLSMENRWRRDPLGNADAILKAAVYEEDPTAKRIARERGWRIPSSTSFRQFKGIGRSGDTALGNAINAQIGNEERMGILHNSFHGKGGDISMDDSMQNEIDALESNGNESTQTEGIPQGVMNVIHEVLDTMQDMQLKAKYRTDNPVDVYVRAFEAKVLRSAVLHQVHKYFDIVTVKREAGIRYKEALETVMMPLIEKFKTIVVEGDYPKIAIDLNDKNEDPKWLKYFAGQAPDEEEDDEDEFGNPIRHAWKYRERTEREVVEYAKEALTRFVIGGELKALYERDPKLNRAIQLIGRIEKFGMADNPIRTSKDRLSIAQQWKDAIEAKRSGDEARASSIADELENSGNSHIASKLRRKLAQQIEPESGGDNEEESVVPESYERTFSKLYASIFS